MFDTNTLIKKQECDPSMSLSLDEYFFLSDLNDRKIILTGEIDAELVEQTVYQIVRINQEDAGKPRAERVPIKIFLCSEGGSVSDGLRLVDAIQASLTPVITINTGYWYSMGFSIGVAADRRYGTKHSSYLIHDGSVGLADSCSKVHDFLKFNSEMNNRIQEFILENTKIPPDEYAQNSRVEWYMFADEAKKYGIIDGIIGEDCEFEDIM